MGVGRLRLVVVMAAVASCLALGGATRSQAASWRGPTWADPIEGRLARISCASPSFCATVDNGGRVFTFDGGSWSAPLQVNSYRRLTSISCPSSTFCMAVGAPGVGVAFDGSSWSAPVRFDPRRWTKWGASSMVVSCTSSSFCMAARSDTASAFTYSGTTWTPQASPPMGVNALSCATPTFCVGVSGYATYVFDGVSWSGSIAGAPPAISCLTPTFCMGVADKYWTSFDGSKWADSQVIKSDSSYNSVSCVSSSFCVAAGLDVAMYDGSGWAPDPTINTFVRSVSCPTTTFCAAVDWNEEDVYTWDGASWSSAIPLTVIAGIPTGISCPTRSFCAAVDTFGAALTYDGTSWSAPVGIDPRNRLTGISCPTPGFCVAIDSVGRALVLRGTTWSAPSLVGLDRWHSLVTVSCADPGFCVAVDGYGGAYIFDGTSWSQPIPAIPNSQGGVSYSLSCPTRSFCALVGFWGEVSTFDGTGWTGTHQWDINAQSVSCTGPDFCVATGSGSARIFNGRSWSTREPVSKLRRLGSVSCVRAGACLAFDRRGRTFRLRDGAWSEVADTNPKGGIYVSCPRLGFCMALDHRGEAFIYS